MSEWRDNERLRTASERQASEGPFAKIAAGLEETLTRLGACDPRLLERLGVRREVCEAAAKHVQEQEPGA